MHLNAPPHVFEQAKQKRQNMTPAEKKLWQALRGKKLEEFKFRRQHPFGNFIVDFYCHKAKLAVEVDSSIPLDEQQRVNDSNRTAQILASGLTEIRFTSEEILKDLTTVLQKIATYLK